MKRKFLSILLTLAMALTLLPTAAMAEGDSETPAGGEPTPVEAPAETKVAQIGDVKYDTLAEAVAAVADGGTVMLLADVTELETISITGGKKVDLNLNEKNITFKADNYFLVDNGALNVTGKGNITSSHGNDDKTWLPTIYAYGTDTDTANYSVVTVGKDVVIDNRGSYGLAIGHKNFKAYGAKVIVEGTVTSTYGFTVTGNAIATEGNIPEITVTESGKIVSTDGSAIYAAGYGTYNIAGTLSGTEFGIEIRAGKLNVEDTAKISATGNFSDPVPNGNGSTVTGAAIAVSQHTTNLPIDVNIKGGEISETGTNGHALYEIDTVENEKAENVAKDVSITVSGGSFNGNVYSTNNKLSITGGAFTDLTNAVKYAADGATIKLADDVTEDVTIPAGKTITLDLNSKTLTNVKDHTILNNGNLTITGTGKVDNISHAKGALYNKGTVVVNGGTFDRSKENGKNKGESGQNSWYTIKNVGTMTINDGAIVQTAGNNASLGKFSSLVSNGYFNAGDYTNNKGLDQPILTIDGGTFRGGLNTIKNDDRAKLTINGGTFSNYYQAVVQNHNVAEITGGTFTAASDANAETYGIYNCGCAATIDLGTLTVSGGTFTGATYAVADVSSENPVVTISGGQFAGTKAAIVKSSTSNATIAISGGLFSSDPSAYVAAGHYVDASNNGDYPYTVKEGTKPAGALIVVKDKTEPTVSGDITGTDKTAINNVIGNANVDGVAEAAKKADIVAKSGATVAENDKVEIEVAVKVEAKAADLAKGQLTFEASPVATVKVNGTVKGTVPVSNGMLNNNPITVKLPLPTVDGKLFTPKQILHKFTGGGYEYFINESVGGMRGAGSFKIEDNCAVFTIYGFSTFELSGTVTYVVPSSGGGSSSSSRRYDVSAPSVKHGDVTVSPKSASKGDTVTITVKPDSGYELDTLTVKDASGSKIKVKDKGDGKFTFTMPASKVTVSAEFAEIETLDFADVSTDAYYYEAVKWAAKKGITGGTGDGTFNPNGACTRAHIVTFLWRAAGSPEPKSTVSFADVPAGSYYAKAVAWAVENGITLGTGDGTFSPNATCTRAQSVTFLYRALGTAPTTVNGFTDVTADAFYADAVAWAVESGVTNGTSASTFSPNNGCTRAQIVTFLYRTMK
ncbi:S-layer homology domain-containing protein [Dysosmobacter sp.]|uniref:S-layer homology domain-containing protein n=1 Tax=Dysosmobacter sp. TaxID=2591382 RepID=UPI00307C9E50